MTDRIVIDVDRDGWTKGLQLNIAQLDEAGSGWGYRLAGPKYNGSSANLLRRELDERDASEIRKRLDVVFPLPPGGPTVNSATPLFLAEFDSAEPTVHLTFDAAVAHCDDIARAVASGRPWDWSRRNGVHVQFWTHPDDDRALHFTGGEVTEVRVQPSETDADPQFFLPGATYSYGPWAFRCDTVTTHPETGKRTALGWFRFRKSEWTPEQYDEDAWAEGTWAADTDGGKS